MLKQIIDLYEVLDSQYVTAADIHKVFERESPHFTFRIIPLNTILGNTEFITIKIQGKKGKTIGGAAPTLGILGTLGGIGARPAIKGFVSDGDGALAALACGLKLLRMKERGDELEGDVIISTHICPCAPTVEHFPVPFMGAAATDEQINRYTVSPEMDAILSIDTSKGNEITNHNGFAITPTVKEGYILKVSSPLLEIVKRTTGRMPVILPLSQQDITPYGNGLSHINSILQPAVSTSAPVVGVGITTEIPIAGCASGASHLMDIEAAARFAIETAKEFSQQPDLFYDRKEYALMLSLYGSQRRFQQKGVLHQKNIGLLTIGNSSCEELIQKFRELTEPKFVITHMDALEGLTWQEMKRQLSPDREDDPCIQLGQRETGQKMKASKEKIESFIQQKVRLFNEIEIPLVLLIASDVFLHAKKAHFAIELLELVELSLTALAVKKLGILVPKEKMPQVLTQYRDFQPVIQTAAPGQEEKMFTDAGLHFAANEVDLILLDSIDYTQREVELVKGDGNVPVVLPHVLAAGILNSLI